MPRKKFEEVAYDPFKAEQERTAALPDAGGEIATETTPAPAPRKRGAEKVVEILRPAASALISPEQHAATPPSYGPTKRFKVTDEEDAAFEEFIFRLRVASGSKVDFSVLSRVFWAVAQHGETQLAEALQKKRPPKRPSKNDPLAMAEYEAAWVEAVITAFRRLPPAPK